MSLYTRHLSGSPYEAQIGFCRAVRVDDRVLVSGTAPLDEAGATVAAGDPGAQARRCFRIIRDAVDALGGKDAVVVRTRIYLVNAADWAPVAAAQREAFGHAPPASTFVVVAGLLRPDWMVEVEAEAHAGGLPEARNAGILSP